MHQHHFSILYNEFPDLSPIRVCTLSKRGNVESYGKDFLDMQTILVTGGTGLVGRGIQLALERTKEDGKQSNENWIFLSSKDANLL